MRAQMLRRLLCVVSVTAVAAFGLVPGAGVAGAEPATVIWNSGGNPGLDFERTISNSTPGVGEIITVSTKVEYKSFFPDTIEKLTDLHHACLNYIPGSATAGTVSIDPFASDETSVTVRGSWSVAGTRTPEFQFSYRVGEDCPRNIATSTGIKYWGLFGQMNFLNSGPEVTVTDGGGSGKNDLRNVPAGYSVDSNWWDWPDTDNDGIPDNWESSGVWVGGKKLDLANAGARVGVMDLFVYMDHEEGSQLSAGSRRKAEEAFSKFPLPGGSALHIIDGKSLPSDIAYSVAWTLNGTDNVPDRNLYQDAFRAAQAASGFDKTGWYGDAGRGVPRLAKYFVNLAYRQSTVDGAKKDYVGQATPKGYGWTAYDGKLGINNRLGINLNPAAKDFSMASNLIHEIGHTLGLLHYGDKNCDPKGKESDCKNRSTAYKSVMSYAYNLTGIGRWSDFAIPLNTIEYSAQSTPHYDYNRGSAPGQLNFIRDERYPKSRQLDGRAQFGEDDTLDAVIEDGDEMLLAMSPSAFDSFAKEFEVTERPDFPLITPTTTHFTGTGSAVTGTLPASDIAGSAIELVVATEPDHGTFTVEGQNFTYTPTPGYVGDDIVSVRATNGKLSSEPMDLTFTTRGGTTNPGTPPDGGGGGSLAGLFGS